MKSFPRTDIGTRRRLAIWLLGALVTAAPRAPAAVQSQAPPVAPAPQAPQAEGCPLTHALLTQELERLGRPTAERSAPLAIQQVLGLLESQGPALAAYQARAYLGLEEPLLAGAGSGAAGELPSRAPALELGERDGALMRYALALASTGLARALAEPSAGPAGQSTDPGEGARRSAEVQLWLQAADRQFGLAELEAGSGALRLRSLYNQGALRLMAAESVFLSLASEQLLQGGAPLAPGPEQPSLRQRFQEAAQAFRAARDPLLLRLALDWRHADTRANLEWIQRRLAEIEHVLEKLPEDPPPQAQESGQPPEDSKPPQDPASKDSESEGSKASEDSEQNQEQQPQQPGQADPQQADPQGEPDRSAPDQASPPDASKQSPEQEPGSENASQPEDESEGQQDAPRPQSPQGEAGSAEQQPPGSPEDPAEQAQSEGQPRGADQPAPLPAGEPDQISAVEVQHILDRLDKLEALRAEVLARRRAASRAKVTRDW